MDGGDPYRVLGIERGAGADEIRRAFRRAVLRYHPDVYEGDPDVGARLLNEAHSAYERLIEAQEPGGSDIGEPASAPAAQPGPAWPPPRRYNPPPWTPPAQVSPPKRRKALRRLLWDGAESAAWAGWTVTLLIGLVVAFALTIGQLGEGTDGDHEKSAEAEEAEREEAAVRFWAWVGTLAWLFVVCRLAVAIVRWQQRRRGSL